MMVKDGIDPTSVEGARKLPYAMPMLPGRAAHAGARACRCCGGARSAAPTPPSSIETFIDELPHAAGKDPLAFRLALLGQEPARRRRARARRREGRLGHGRRAPGVRAGRSPCTSRSASFVAQVAEVSIEDGKVKVERVVCAVDCGVAVNPDVIRAQMEGGIGFGLGALYYGEITLKDGRAAQTNFDTYRVAAHPRDAGGRGPHRAVDASSRPASASRACRRSRRRWPTRSPGSAGRACAACRSRARGWSRPEARPLARRGGGRQ